jgi:hypothetical protein
MRVLAAPKDAVLSGNNNVPDLWPHPQADAAADPVAAAPPDRGVRTVIRKRALLPHSTCFLTLGLSLCHCHCINLSNCIFYLATMITVTHLQAGSRSSTGSRASLGTERLDCLVLKREEGAPKQTIAEYQLLLELERHSEAAKFVAHRSLSAHKVKYPHRLNA